MTSIKDKKHKEDLKILGHSIALGENKSLDLNIAHLFTHTPVEVPVIITRSKIPGPTILITAGIHGDEVNGTEIVRQLISHKTNIPKRGTIICIPVMNVFGFISKSRYFPDGRDLNRVFPGSKNGSLASRFAQHFVEHILPHVDLCMDFHTGGADRFNASQIRIDEKDEQSKELAAVFNAPFTLYKGNVEGSYRQTCCEMGIPILLNESGKSLSLHKEMARQGVYGIKRVLAHFDMLSDDIKVPETTNETIIITNTTWIRAEFSGLIHIKVGLNQYVDKDTVLCTISDPYGSFSHAVRPTQAGYVININEIPMVYQGDAIFNISTSLEE